MVPHSRPREHTHGPVHAHGPVHTRIASCTQPHAHSHGPWPSPQKLLVNIP